MCIYDTVIKIDEQVDVPWPCECTMQAGTTCDLASPADLIQNFVLKVRIC